MLVIRLRRIGRKHDPHYRVVVAEHTAPVQGKFVAEIGHYHPKSKELVIHQDLLTEWMSKGAKPSNTVAKLANRANMTKEALPVKEYQGQPKKKAQEATAAKAEKVAQPAPIETPDEAPANDAEESTETPEEVTTETQEEPTETPAEDTSTEATDSDASAE